MTVALDLDVVRDFGSRLRALFDEARLRAYSAVIVARFQQRTPFGTASVVPLPANTSELLAYNGSDDKALFVAVDGDAVGPTAVVYSASPTVGQEGFGVVQSNFAGIPPEQFVLLPRERLFARSVIAARATVTQEWF